MRGYRANLFRDQQPLLKRYSSQFSLTIRGDEVEIEDFMTVRRCQRFGVSEEHQVRSTLHPLPRGLVELYGLLAVLMVLVPEWIAENCRLQNPRPVNPCRPPRQPGALPGRWPP